MAKSHLMEKLGRRLPRLNKMKSTTTYSQTKPVVIAIRFGDNDFGPTFRSLLNSIAYSLEEGIRLGNVFPTRDKEKIAKIISVAAIGHYRTCQNPYEYNETTPDSQTARYLTIDAEKILLYEEVDEYLAENDWDNAETFVLDMRLPPDQRIFSR